MEGGDRETGQHVSSPPRSRPGGVADHNGRQTGVVADHGDPAADRDRVDPAAPAAASNAPSSSQGTRPGAGCSAGQRDWHRVAVPRPPRLRLRLRCRARYGCGCGCGAAPPFGCGLSSLLVRLLGQRVLMVLMLLLMQLVRVLLRTSAAPGAMASRMDTRCPRTSTLTAGSTR